MMRTKELSKILRELAMVLSELPDVEVRNLGKSVRTREPSVDPAAGAANLQVLLAMASYNKQQWELLLSKLGLNLDIRTRDASRDILGKLLKYLALHPEAVRKLKDQTNKGKRLSGSPLGEAFEILLRDVNL